MTILEKRLARSNARYADVLRMDLIKALQRGPLPPVSAAGARSAGTPHRAQSVWVRLLKAHSLILREVRRDFGEVPTLPQFDVLAQLHRQPEGLTLVDLSRRLLVSAGNLTGIVGRLERDRLVSREEDPRDGRVCRIRLTSRGRGRVRALIPKHARLLEQLLAGLSPDELEELQELLGRLGDSLTRSNS